MACLARSARARTLRVARRALCDGRGKLAVVAMSGGVDSSVAALLLRERGYDVIGLHATSWDAADELGADGRPAAAAACAAEAEWRDVEATCRALGPRVRAVRLDVVREYWTDVFEA